MRFAVVAAVLCTFAVMAPPAQAATASPATVTVSTGGISATAVTAAVGDTFRIANTRATYIAIVNGSGSLRDSEGTCSPANCVVPNDDYVDYTVSGLGTVLITNLQDELLFTLTIGAATGATTSPNRALIYPTITFNANGGDCVVLSANLQSTGEWQITLPDGGQYETPKANECVRGASVLIGWATNRDAAKPEFTPGQLLNLTTSNTLYAVWYALFLTVTADANVGLETPCLTPRGDNLTTSESRQFTRSVGRTSMEFSLPRPFCQPEGFSFAGWVPGPAGSMGSAAPIQTITPRYFAGVNSVLLRAKWEAIKPARSLAITAARTKDSGSNVVVAGRSTGFPAGTVIDGFVKLGPAGAVTQAGVRIDDQGNFAITVMSWKRVEFYVQSQDGAVHSNTVVEPAFDPFA